HDVGAPRACRPGSVSAARTSIMQRSQNGTVGQGGAGARLAPNPLPITAFISYVRNGRRGWSVSGGMPAYPASIISDEKLAAIRAYLASIPVPPPAKNDRDPERLNRHMMR